MRLAGRDFPVSCRANESRRLVDDRLRGGAAGRAAARARRPATPTRAQAHFDRGAKLYNLGHFQDAIGDFEKAYDLDPSPIFLFNIAQSHRQLGNKERALFFYRRYLEQAPNAANRDDVERRMKELQAALQQEAEVEAEAADRRGAARRDARHGAGAEPRRPSRRQARSVAPPPAARRRTARWQVPVGLGPAFPTISGRRARSPTCRACSPPGSSSATRSRCPRASWRVGVDLGYARLPYQRRAPSTRSSRGRAATSAVLGDARAVRYLYAVDARVQAGRRRRGRATSSGRASRREPLHPERRGGQSGPSRCPASPGQLRGEVLLVGGLFVALTPELLWSRSPAPAETPSRA